jgi:tetracycline 7-halogenase / FADH2 O2-dependent halogenase
VIELKTDVAIVGSGFGGSLTALLLQRIGRSAVLIDRTCHPRFAIGESSTPNADLLLLRLAREYDLPRLAPLAKYGTWQATYPEVTCGIKRGFSYFHHRRGQPFQVDPDHATELLVAASPDDERSDTHWLRSSVDAFLAREAANGGIPLLENTTVSLAARGTGWRLSGTQQDEVVQIDADFVIDGTGEFGLIPRTLGIANRADTLATNSRTVFGHFTNLRPWHDLLAKSGGAVADHPFPCDHAALHQVFDDGWMYQLGFNNGVVSAGFVLDANDCPLDESVPIQVEWDGLLRRYPSIAEQFAPTKVVAPTGGPGRTRRLQRRMSQMAGDNWALLPHTAGFIDPLHSTGIAQTLCGIGRLMAIFREHWQKPTLPAALARYGGTVDRELTMIDKLVSACYLARRNFRLFTACAMLYFAAAHTSEQRRLAGHVPADAAFLLADDPVFRELIFSAWEQMRVLACQSEPSPAQIADFEQFIARGLAPYNTAGLCDPACRNMYRYTAVTKA